MVADSRVAGGSSRAQPRYSSTGNLRRCLHPTCRSLLARAHLRPRGPPSKASTIERLEQVGRQERGEPSAIGRADLKEGPPARESLGFIPNDVHEGETEKEIDFVFT